MTPELESARAALASAERAAIETLAGQGKPYPEIAAALGLSTERVLAVLTADSLPAWALEWIARGPTGIRRAHVDAQGWLCLYLDQGHGKPAWVARLPIDASPGAAAYAPALRAV